MANELLSGIFGDTQQQNGSGIPYMPQFGGFGGSGQPADSGSWWADNQGTIQGIGQGIGAFTSLANLYGMFKNLNFQKKAFKFAQEGTKRNFNANATAYNSQVDDQLTHRNAMAALNGRPALDSGIFDQRKIASWG